MDPGSDLVQRQESADPSSSDPEKQVKSASFESKKSVYAGLGWLDRLLVLWILLAIIVGIVLGNFVDDIGPALQRGKFVDVSVPIGIGQQPEFGANVAKNLQLSVFWS